MFQFSMIAISSSELRTPRALGRVLVLTCIVMGLGACGWGYANETYKAEGRKMESTTLLVTPAPTVNTEVVEKDPCEVGTFTLFMVEEGSKAVKQVRCETRQVLSLNRSDITESEYRNYRIKNVPVGKWYVLVDPQSKATTGGDTISNDNLLGVSKRYTLKYYEKLAGTQYIIYTLESDLP